MRYCHARILSGNMIEIRYFDKIVLSICICRHFSRSPAGIGRQEMGCEMLWGSDPLSLKINVRHPPRKLRGPGLMWCEIKYSLFALHPSRATRIISTLTIICSYQHTYTLLLIKFHDVFVSRVPEYWDCWELHNNWIELHQYRYRIHRVSPPSQGLLERI